MTRTSGGHGFEAAYITAGFIGFGELAYVLIRGPDLTAVCILIACVAVIAFGIVRRGM